MILIKPVITEKSIADRQNNKYHFWVDPKASKHQIKQSFESMFGVDVLNISTLNLKGKTKTDWRLRQTNQKPNRKKAIITVSPKQKIDLLAIK